MSVLRVQVDTLVSVHAAGKQAASELESAALELESGESGGSPGEHVRKARNLLDQIVEKSEDLVEDSSPGVDRPIWADPIRLQMIRGTVAGLLTPAEALIPGGSDDLELVLRLIDVFIDLDTSESSS
jgi:hypothetical protein